MRSALGIDIGGTSTKLAIVAEDGRGTVVASARLPTPTSGPEALVEAIVLASGPLRERGSAHGLGIERLGVSVAGFIDPTHETLAYNPNLAFLEGFPLRAVMEKALGLPARLEVDSNAQGLAEHRFGAGRGSARLAFYTLGTGVGGSLIWDGQPLRFFGECAGDMGHFVVEPDGPACGCGARGCLEALLGRERVEVQAGRPVPNLLDAAKAGEPEARRVLARAGDVLGRALAGTVQLYGPDLYVIGGGLSVAGDLLLGPAQAAFDGVVAPAFRGRLTIRAATFGSFGGAIGATVEL